MHIEIFLNMCIPTTDIRPYHKYTDSIIDTHARLCICNMQTYVGVERVYRNRFKINRIEEYMNSYMEKGRERCTKRGKQIDR